MAKFAIESSDCVGCLEIGTGLFAKKAIKSSCECGNPTVWEYEEN